MSEQQDIDWQGPTEVIAADHPSLAGHFPGRPVVPGVVLLDCLRVALTHQRPQWSLVGLPNVKFMSPLLPEQPFCLSIQGSAPRLRFSIRSGERVLVQGQLEVAV